MIRLESPKTAVRGHFYAIYQIIANLGGLSIKLGGSIAIETLDR